MVDLGEPASPLLQDKKYQGSPHSNPYSKFAALSHPSIKYGQKNN